MRDEELRRAPGWLVAKVRCRLCSYAWVAVAPVETNLEDLECARCGNLSGDAGGV